MTSEILRVGNCSGFYGDRLSAMREMLTGGRLDVLTGDYLAELTMLILGRDRLRDPSLGFARTFLRQVEDCLALALEQRVVLVSNAGGLNPSGLAARVAQVAAAQGLAPRIAVVSGDDVVARSGELGLGSPVTANAYLGAFGIAAALRDGADIVVTGRVTDASVVVGPAIAHFGWDREDHDALAGATVAGHVIECGTQATGGNFSGFRVLAGSTAPLGFPIAEIAADGSSVITKHPGTGGLVSVDTVTAQLLYEVQGPQYLSPDVTTHLESIRLHDAGPDRVRISDVTGSPPPGTLKVGCNLVAGHRNSVEFLVTGLDLEDKAAWARAQLTAALADQPPADTTWTLARTDHSGADTEEAATARLRCTVKDPDPAVVGRRFSGAAVELALASYPGFHLSAPPGDASPFGIFTAVDVPQDLVPHTVTFADGRSAVIDPPTLTQDRRPGAAASPIASPGRPLDPPTDMVRLPLGRMAHARSGDKGGNANLGIWFGLAEPGSDDAGRDLAAAEAKRAARAAWLREVATPEWVATLIPEVAATDVEIHPLPNLYGINIVCRGLLGDGVAASTRFDPQAKALGEWARSRLVTVPAELAGAAGPAGQAGQAGPTEVVEPAGTGPGEGSTP